MATDPEARATGNSAMIIGLVLLALAVAAIAYFMTNRGDTSPDVVAVPGGTSTVVKETTKEVPVPATGDSPDVIVNPPTSGSTSSSTTTESTTTIEGGTSGGEESSSSTTSSTTTTGQ